MKLSHPNMAANPVAEAFAELVQPQEPDGEAIDASRINGDGAPQFPVLLPHGFQGGPVLVVGASPLLSTDTEERLRADFRRMAAPPPPKVEPTPAPKPVALKQLFPGLRKGVH